MLTPPPPQTRASARRRFPAALFLLLPLVALGAALFPSAPRAGAGGPRAGERADAAAPDASAVAEAYGKLPLQFEANRGQTDARVRFISRGDGYVMFLTPDEAVLALGPGGVGEAEGGEQQGFHVLRMRLAGARPSPAVGGLEELQGRVNYFVGGDASAWQTNVPVYGRVHYAGVYEGVDLVYYGNQRQLEFDFHVAPGADPRDIRLTFEGAERAEVDGEDGGLSLRVGGGEVRLKRPVIYQVGDDGARREVEGGYSLRGGGVEFRVGAYDARKPLVIDPILSYSTFLGVTSGNNFLGGPALALDASGSTYVAGSAGSLAFPAPGVKIVPPGSFSSNVFVTKLSPAGDALVYTSYLGGFSDDTASGLALDPSGSAYVTGRTTSGDFPTADAFRANDSLIRSADGGATWQPGNAGLQNRPVTRLWADPASGQTLYALTFNGLYKTADGGATWGLLNTGLNTPGSTSASALAVAPSNPSTLYAGSQGPSSKVVKSNDGGATWSPANNGLPGLNISGLGVHPADPSLVYAGTSFDIYKTTDGGANWTKAGAGVNFGNVTTFVFDPANASVVYALSGGPVFKTTNGGASWSQATGGISPAAVNALVMPDPANPSTLYAGTGSGGVYKTTDGAANWTQVNTGLTNLSVRSLAADPAAPSTLYAGTTRGGVFKTTDGGATWAQARSGMGGATVLSLAVSASSQVYAGVDTIVGGSMPDAEAFLTKLSPAGDALVYSTYLGGLGEDSGAAVAVDASGGAYVTGQTASADFPAAGPRASSLKGSTDAFVTRFSPAGASLVFSTLVGGSGVESGRSVALDSAGAAYVTGETSSPNFPATPGAFSTTLTGNHPFPDGNDGFVFKIDAAGSALSYATFLGGNGDDRARDIAVDSAGAAYVTGSTASTNFPTVNAVRATPAGSFSVYAAKLNPSGSGLVYSTYLGAGLAQSIALDAAGAAYLTGATSSMGFPVTPDTLKHLSPLFRTADSGATWRNDNFGLDAGGIGGNPGSFHELVADPVTRHVLYASSDDGVYKSTDGGRRWARASGGLTVQRVSALAIDPKTPSTLYAGSGLLGFNTPAVFKTTDGGASWSPLASTSAFQFAPVIAVDAASNVYVYTGANTLVKSADGGATWGAPGAGSPGSVNTITADPSNPSVVYAAGNGGVFKTTDGGANWSPSGAGMSNVAVGRVAVAAADPSVLYANTSGGVYKTTDGGASWSLSLKGVGLSRLIAVDPSDASTAYAYMSQPLGSFSTTSSLYRTTDGGATWSVLHAAPPQPLKTLAVDPFARTNVYVTIDTFGFADSDAFLLKLAPAGGPVVYSTLLGGRRGFGASSNDSTTDQGSSVAVDAQGAAYVAGVSFTSDFPVTPGSFLPYNRRGLDVFVSRVVASHAVGGVVTDAGAAPRQGVKVTLSGSASGTQFTGADGAYLFANLAPGGAYTVSATKAGSSFTPPSHTFSNLGADQTANFTLGAGAASHRITGRLTEPGGAPVPGATVALSGSQVELTTTDVAGAYGFDAPAGGAYTVTPAALGFTFGPPSGSVNNLSSDRTLDFTAARQDFVVTNTNDAGAGSLRQAMLDANATPGRDRIAFDIPGAGVRTISPNSALPTVVEPVTIDATTQPGYAGSPVVELSGVNNVPGAGFTALTITAGESVVRGLCINRFGGSGVALTGGGGNRIEGNVIGLDPAGAVKRPNRGSGVTVSQGSAGNFIGGASPAQRNVISGNDVDGVSLLTAGNHVVGNYIGTDAAGASALGNGGGTGNGWGVVTNGAGGEPAGDPNVIGGAGPGARNVISGNASGGVDASRAGTVIRGNYIGTDAAGASKLGNGSGVKVSGANVVVGGVTPEARNVISGNGRGVWLNPFVANPNVTLKGNYIGTDAAGASKLGNDTGVYASGQALIGGTEPGAGNLISGNDSFGIQMDSFGPGGAVKGNFIGTDVTGLLPLGNRTGIDIQGSNNVVGGAEPGARNVISGNDVGVSMGGLTTSGPANNVVRGNLIGVDAAGAAPLPNRSLGVGLFETTNTSIGGDAPGEGNTIAFNGLGVYVSFSAVRNTFRGNSIFSNALLGIDLEDNSAFRGVVTPNDAGDADAGGNGLQNFPVISAADAGGDGATRVRGSLGGKPNTQFRVDFYSNLACSPSGHGEGARPLGATQVTTGADGAARFDVTLPAQLEAGRAVTATATDPAGGSSEFSPCDASAATGSLQFGAPDYNVLEDVGAAAVRVVRTGGSRGALSVNYTTGGGTATAGADYTPASGQFTFAEGETEKTILIPVADDGAAEPAETVLLTLALPPGADLESLGGKTSATLHIFDASTPLTLAPGSLTGDGVIITEGSAGRRNAVVTIHLSAATGRAVTVDYRTEPALAAAPADFIPVSGTLNFAPGETTRDVLIPIVGDTVDEFDENFRFDLFNPSGASPLVPQFDVVIRDDDAPPALSVTDVTVSEESTRAVFTVRLSRPSGKVVNAVYNTADGTATAGSDYTAASAGGVAFNFQPGETVKFIQITVANDGVRETEETFALNVTGLNPTRASLADGQGQATIVDAPEARSFIWFEANVFTVGEAEREASVTVRRSDDATQPATVDFATVSQTASERSDFTATYGTLRFAAGETIKSFGVLIANDRFLEGAESFEVVLSNPTGAGAVLSGPNVALVTITSDDAADGPSPVRESSFDSSFFVRQHYADFLNRQPDTAGLAHWTNEIESCGADAQCREVRRINVSAAFFLSIEFQETGYLAYRTFKAAYGDATSPNVEGTVPVIRLNEFLSDSRRIGEGVVVGLGDWQSRLDANKQAYMAEFVRRQRFLDAFPLTMSAAEFVDVLNQNVGGVLSQAERDALVAELAAAPDQTLGRANALRRVAEDEDLKAAEKNRAFVLMQFYGYLRRNPDDPQDTDFRGWRFWLSKLEEFGGDYVAAEMVKAFITSDEYTERFGR